ncbi:solute carrier family 52, riboflavin transporter, member 3-B [Caerostris extrusa]|uniref:Riboflavin transporter n=1 Tax=Caerostris extrusa TaxID=172846 RepID=A0AAV4PVY4_CAEEX|nr:solute carrier family 52, riboflavin transporter, member 3-B [Caerostris extrusa]
MGAERENSQTPQEPPGRLPDSGVRRQLVGGRQRLVGGAARAGQRAAGVMEAGVLHRHHIPGGQPGAHPLQCGSQDLVPKSSRNTHHPRKQHSTALLILAFFLSFVDCTSSLLYLPFIANFKEQYVISYLIGSGLSGPVPGLLAMAQGVGGYADCRNVTVSNATDFGNVTEYVLQPFYPPPRFSSNIFFGILSGQMMLSWIAFVLLNSLPQAKRERVPLAPISRPSNPALAENFQSSTVDNDFSTSIEKPSSVQNLLGKPGLPKSHYYLLLLIQGFLSTIHNGVLLSIQTYSCLPYGSLAFHLTVTLSSIANPLCCFIAIFVPISNVHVVAGIAFYTTGWASYILATALMSPAPPFVDASFGAFLVVTAWIMVSGAVAFNKACIASILRREGGQVALYRCGVVTQIGSAIGAIVTFSLIQYTTLFKSYTPCT